MSFNIFANVWDNSPQEGTALLIMLSLADNADPDSGTVTVDRDHLAERARISEGELSDWLRHLVSEREIVPAGPSTYRLAPIYWEVDDRAAASKAPRAPMPGFVYILKTATGEYKIGLTKDPASRMATFGLTLPFRVNYELVIASADMRGLEKDLHAEFAHKRLDGEWFALTDDDVNDLRERYAE